LASGVSDATTTHHGAGLLVGAVVPAVISSSAVKGAGVENSEVASGRLKVGSVARGANASSKSIAAAGDAAMTALHAIATVAAPSQRTMCALHRND
jgi:hypothetical protein